MKKLLAYAFVVAVLVYGFLTLVGGMVATANPEILRNLEALAQILK